MSINSKQLVIGSTGSLGCAIVNELTSSGKPVRALVRNPEKAKKIFTSPDKVEMVEGSVEDIQVLNKALNGIEIFHNCINVPYFQWSRLPEIHGRILEVAARTKAKSACRFCANAFRAMLFASLFRRRRFLQRR